MSGMQSSPLIRTYMTDGPVDDSLWQAPLDGRRLVFFIPLLLLRGCTQRSEGISRRTANVTQSLFTDLTRLYGIASVRYFQRYFQRIRKMEISVIL